MRNLTSIKKEARILGNKYEYFNLNAFIKAADTHTYDVIVTWQDKHNVYRYYVLKSVLDNMHIEYAQYLLESVFIDIIALLNSGKELSELRYCVI